MDHFNYRDGELCVEDIPLSYVVKEFGSPVYVYSKATLERHWHAFDDALVDYPHMICYAVKANSNVGVLNVMAKMGSGFDIVSLGELERVLVAEGDPKKIVFSGVGKTAIEIERALDVGIHCFNVESEAELDRIQNVAKLVNKVAPISLRVNPNVDAKTHPYIATGLKANKFGIPAEKALAVYQKAKAMSHIDIKGIDCHIGSQLTELEPFLDALDKILALIDELAENDIVITHINLGGGLGVRYSQETPPHPSDYAKALLPKLKMRDLTLVLEPGRAIAANAGVLLTRVEYLKNGEEKNFAIVDAAMNDLLRPALYDAYQEIIPVHERTEGEKATYDVVGPVCETGDFLGKDRELNIQAGDVLAVRGAGAYGFSMSSNYNSRPRAAEVLVSGNQLYLVRARETIMSMLVDERLPVDEG
tara:strand:+ start:81367 stop:82623 length:1257 start_codon:yes stop_codon:yes gene_type:complete